MTMHKTRNKGFSLVEVIVSIAIASIVLLCVSSFLSVSANVTKKTSATVLSQQETQRTMNQLNRYIMEATKGVRVYTSSPIYKKTMVLYNDGNTAQEKYVQLIVYDESGANLYYDKVMVTGGFTGTESQVNQYITDTMRVAGKYDENKMMSSNVSSLDIYLDKIDQAIVKVSVTTSINGSVNTLTNKITLRNQPVIDPTVYK